MRAVESLDPRITEVVTVVAEVMHVPAFLLMSRSRNASHAEARQIAMYAVRMLHSMSYESIGWAFHRDHTTAMHACRTVRRRMKVDPQLAGCVNLIVGKLTPKPAPPSKRRACSVMGLSLPTLNKIRLAFANHPELIQVVTGGAA